MKKITYLIILSLLINKLSFSQNQEKDFESLKSELTEYLEKKIKKSKVVGLSFALVDDQEIVWSGGFGYADKENEKKATDLTVYRVCSISKLFTATSVMQLADAGKIDIDKPIQNYIPDFSIKSRFKNPGEITPRNLLTHHSGLPSTLEYMTVVKNPVPLDTLVYILKNEYTCTQPNTILSYSNEGYTLLGVLTEKVSGENFYDYTQNHLFKPMKMRNTSFELTPEMKNLSSKNYFGGKDSKDHMFRTVPAGELYSNVLDMANFIKMTFNEGSFNENQILKSNTLNEMQTKQNKDCKLDIDQKIGFGWWLHTNAWGYGGKVAQHGGDWAGFHGQLTTLTDHKIGVIVITNTDRGVILVRTAADKILQEYLKYKKDLKAPEETVKTKKVKLKKDLESAEGDYFLTSFGIVSFEENNNKLTAKTKMGKLVLKPTSKDFFSAKVRLFGILPINLGLQLGFREIDNKDYVLFKDQLADTSIIGIRTNEELISETWKERFGTYENINEDLNYSIAVSIELYEDIGYIHMKTTSFSGRISTDVLKPISENEAVFEGIGTGTGKTISFDENGAFLGGIKFRRSSQE